MFEFDFIVHWKTDLRTLQLNYMSFSPYIMEDLLKMQMSTNLVLT